MKCSAVWLSHPAFSIFFKPTEMCLFISFLPSLFARLNFRRFFRRTFRSWRFIKSGFSSQSMFFITNQGASWEFCSWGRAGDREHRAARALTPHLSSARGRVSPELLLPHVYITSSSSLVSSTILSAGFNHPTRRPLVDRPLHHVFLFFQRRRLLRNTNPRLVSDASDPPESFSNNSRKRKICR